MTVVGYSTLEVIPSVKGLARSLEKQTSGDLTTAGRKGGKQFGDAAGREAATGFKTRFSGAMKGFAPLAGLVAGVGVTAFFKDAIDGASGLQEAGTKLQAIYGDAAREVQDFAKTAAEDLGQTRLQALDAAATFGTFGKAAKLSGSDLASFSTELVSLSTDLASFFNTDVDTAIQAIGSGLRGEAEPLRQFGVLLDDATLRQEALRQGLIQTTKQALTPQQKVLAAHAVILAQTADAQGDFERTSGGLANQQRALTAQWSEMKTAVGEELLPAVTSLATTMNDSVLPAMGEVGGAVKDAAEAFAGLPGPIKAGTAAFVALRIAAAAGIGTAVAGAVAGLGSAFIGLRLRLMEVVPAYNAARSASITLIGPLAGVSLGASRASAALAGLRAASVGAGTALRSGLGKSLAIVGGPWGAAMIAGTILVTKFWQEQQEAKQFVDDLTASIDAQTGALKDNGREQIADALRKSGAVAGAKELGIALEDLQLAAEGDERALSRVKGVIDDIGSGRGFGGRAVDRFNPLGHFLRDDDKNAANAIRDALSDVGASLDDARTRAQENAEMLGGTGVAATGRATEAYKSYRTQIDETRGAIQKLIDAEHKRVLNAIQQGRDEIALLSTMKATRDEALKGARTLDINTQAGRENKAALLDLADQWANSTPKARAAIGGYEEMRQQFIKVAREMGATKTQAEQLADKLLKVPKTAPLKFQSEGFQARMREIQILKEEAAKLRAAFRIVYTSQASAQQSALADRRGFATGGMIGGRGTGTSDSNLIWASKGEFMQRKAAVDYYGVEFMRRLNALQIPKFAQGGPIMAPAATSSPSAPLIDMRGAIIQPPNFKGFMTDLQRRTRDAQGGGVPA